MKKWWSVLVISIMLILISTAFAEAALAREALSDRERRMYDSIIECYDRGEAVQAMIILADEQETDAVYTLFTQSNPELLENGMLEALRSFDENGDMARVAFLRMRGYISDIVFERYWTQLGLADELESIKDIEGDVDPYLIGELIRGYQRSDDGRRMLIDMRCWGFIDDTTHQALIERLGVDYMDEIDMQKYVPLMGMALSEEDQALYLTVKNCIDEGIGLEVAEMMLTGQISPELYAYLMARDTQIMDVIIAYALESYAANGEFEKIVRLGAKGYVSDACFGKYWELLGRTLPQGSRTDEMHPGIDMYLLHEIEQICLRKGAEAEFLKTLWLTDILSEEMKELIVTRVGRWEE